MRYLSRMLSSLLAMNDFDTLADLVRNGYGKYSDSQLVDAKLQKYLNGMDLKDELRLAREISE